ncbi:MAG: response regulator transcription factor [Bacteroidales bacterium]|nr:response regulator transcription factor [Bacteroidales bacterium]HOK97885.1 response regulator transcription factor [Bacteroidales bacterium]HPO64650.1 response regulator transcription factor [Bacteroidales bacterium]
MLPLKKYNILLVDDNQHFREALRYMLEESNPDGIETIFEAGSGKEALDLIRQHHIDMVFMDIEMPDMNGIEATRLATEQNRFIVIIALSFHKEMQYVMQMLEAGARNYIIKEDINTQALKKIFENSLS